MPNSALLATCLDSERPRDPANEDDRECGLAEADNGPSGDPVDDIEIGLSEGRGRLLICTSGSGADMGPGLVEEKLIALISSGWKRPRRKVFFI